MENTTISIEAREGSSKLPQEDKWVDRFERFETYIILFEAIKKLMTDNGKTKYLFWIYILPLIYLASKYVWRNIFKSKIFPYFVYV